MEPLTRYSTVVRWSDEDEGFIATCPELPGLSAFGETAETAVSEIAIALKPFLESYQENGVTPPAPRVASSYSGQLRLRLPISLHEAAAELAAQEGISLNQLLVGALQDRVTSHHCFKEFSQALQLRHQAVLKDAAFAWSSVRAIVEKISSANEFASSTSTSSWQSATPRFISRSGPAVARRH